jgi:two-component system heavy metal sensor histidine kinase CusS
VFLNLLSNALNASPAGGRVTLTSRFEAGLWRVCFEDHGAGVLEPFRERIFERFFRLPKPDAGDDGGSGLGLAICRSIIALHGGAIWAESAPAGVGLRMVFTLPLAG